jgi:hypothetical protein
VRAARAFLSALLVALLVAPLVVLVPTGAAGAAEPLSTADCVAMTGTTVDAGEDASAQVLAAVEVAEGAASQHCRLTVRVGGRITMDLRAPFEGWEQRYAQVGGGGFCGTVPTATGGFEPYLARGTAVASDDTGHVSSPFNADWALGNPQSQVDWAHLSEHLVRGASHALLADLYGSAPATSYFLGCSTGGRQALMSAQRYPDDFDGIVAGAPANRQSYLAVLSQGYRERVNHDAAGLLVLREPDAALAASAVLERCDGLDGLEDGVLGDPRQCPLDPAELLCEQGQSEGCLDAAKVEVLRRWYDDPRDSAGTSMYPGGIPRGSEAGLNLTNIGGDGRAYSFGGMFADQVLRYLAFPQDPPPTYSLEDFDFDTDRELLRPQAEALYNADDPDMSAFRDSGGKLLLWHGFADPLITPLATIQYYEDGVAAMGGLDDVQQWYRMFLPPGVYHCSGGPGPDGLDWFAAIVAWVEDGVPTASVLATGNGVTRPVFPYPLTARYSGGDPALASSFAAVPAPRGRTTGSVRPFPPGAPASQSTAPPAAPPAAAPGRGAALPVTGGAAAPVGVATVLLMSALLLTRRRGRSA